MSAFEPMKIKLRDGRTVLIRTPTLDDAQGMRDYLDALRVEAPHIMFSPQDELPTLQQEREFLASGFGPDALRIVAEHGGEIVASASVTRMKMFKTRHRSTLGIGIRAPWRGVGLGKHLMQELIRFARRHPEIEQIELCVFVENVVAHQLYEKLGFEVFGKLTAAVRHADGRTDDEWLMRLATPYPEPPSPRD
ncbi:MAG: GNAT family N-acetyltransferase [Planctomycetota bacterium]